MDAPLLLLTLEAQMSDKQMACMQMPKWNLTMRWLNIWRWGELAKHYLFDDLIVRQLFPQLWESTTNYHHGGTE